MKKLSDPDWKLQKEALDEIDRILTLNPRILQDNLTDFNNCLKNGLKDKKNKSLLRVYINLVAKFAECSGKDFFNYAKVLIQHLLSSLSDKQALVRCDVTNALHKIENCLNSEFLLNHISIFLLNNENKDGQSIEMKQEVLNWFLKNSSLLVKFPNLKALLPIFLNMLLDKNKDIRIMTDQLCEKISVAFGTNIFADSIKNLKPSLLQQIKPLFEKFQLSYKAALEIQGNCKETQKIIEITEKSNINPEEIKENVITAIKINNEICIKNDKNININENILKIEKIKLNKQERMQQDQLKPWPVNEINDELIDDLKDAFTLNFSEIISKKLFSYDLKKNIESLQYFKKSLSPMDLIASSDMMFKWILFKLMNYLNDDLIDEILEYMTLILEIMIQSQTQLFELEIKLVLNSLKKVKEINWNKNQAKIDQINRNLFNLYNNEYIDNFWGNSYMRKPDEKPDENDNKKYKPPRNSFVNNNNISFDCVNNIINESPIQNISKKTILDRNLDCLNWSSVPGKIDALLNIYNFLSEETPENKKVIEEEATNIAKTISHLFKPDIDNNNMNYNTPYQFINYLVKISLKIFGNKLLLDNINYDVLLELIESILQRLLIEDANKTDIKNYKDFNEINNDLPIKNLNSLMLKILETCSANNIFQILFDLLIKHRKSCIFSKFIALVIKCILKLTKVMEVLLPALDLEKLFLKFHIYVCEFFNENFKNNEDLGVKTIKTIINEIIKIKGPAILDYYHVIASHEKVDKYIFRFLYNIIIFIFKFLKMD